MKNLKLQQTMNRILRAELEGRGVCGTEPAVQLLRDVVSSITIDRDLVLQCVEAELAKKTGNPINALLGLIGLRIVNTRDTVERLDDQLGRELAFDSPSAMERFISIDEAAMSRAVGAVVSSLEAVEAAQRSRTEQYMAELRQVHQARNSTEHESMSLRAELDSRTDSVAERAQYCLALLRQDRPQECADALSDMLEDMGIEVVWPAGAGDRAGLFMTLPASPGRHNLEKPCLLRAGKVLKKGLRFTGAESSGGAEE